MTPEQQQELFAKLESDGVDRVKEDLAANKYGQPKIPTINVWLEKKDTEKKDKQHNDLLLTQQRLVNSSWVAAAIAFAAAIISIISIFFK